MSLNLNKVVLAGRVTADIELKQTPSSVSVVSFTIAVNRRYVSKSADAQAQPQADFIRVTAWRNTAEFISKYFHKGSAICITGSIQTRSWQDQNGQKQFATEVVADEAMFVESKSDAAQGGYSPEAYSAPSFSSGANDAPKFEDVNTDDSFLPF